MFNYSEDLLFFILEILRERSKLFIVFVEIFGLKVWESFVNFFYVRLMNEGLKLMGKIF